MMQETDEIDVEGDVYEPEEANLSTSSGKQNYTEFTPYEWLYEQQMVSTEHCDDEESRAVIQQMLEEEKYYVSGKTQKLTATISMKKEDTSRVTSKCVRRWSDDEKARLKKGIETHGYNWMELERLLPLRNMQQIKSFVRRNQHNKSTNLKMGQPHGRVEPPASLEEAIQAVTTAQGTIRTVKRQPTNLPDGKSSTQQSNADTTSSEVIKLKRPQDEDTDEDVDIELNSDDDLMGESPLSNKHGDCLELPQDQMTMINENIPTKAELDLPNPSKMGVGRDLENSHSHSCNANDQLESKNHSTKNEMLIMFTDLDKPKDHRHTDLEKIVTSDNDSRCEMTNSPSDITEAINSSEEEDSLEKNDYHSNEFPILTSTGKLINMTNPTVEKTIDPSSICDEEHVVHSEFFDGSSTVKTPDRYLKIRNYLLDSWNRCKPEYLSKTAARKGLKNCGDVNCIGRIHAHLEQMGAVNFGCELARYNQGYKQFSKSNRSTNKMTGLSQIAMSKSDAVGIRKRRVRDAFGEWVDEKDLEGFAIPHDVEKDKTHRIIKRAYDPFKLIPCMEFTSDNPAPFTVLMESCAAVIMDVHSHLSKTEVIGLLGGHYNQQEQRLWIQQAEPCASLSTGMQCEMDPVSQTEASERISHSGQTVVGWYHSHPMFVANPSIRDLETQEGFQDWFALGGCPFVGVILSPYGGHLKSMSSEINLLMVRQDTNSPTCTSTALPYSFQYKASHYHWNRDYILDHITKLATEYSSKPNHVELLHHFKTVLNVTCLEKMLQSLGQHLQAMDHKNTNIPAAEAREITTAIEHIFQSIYKSDNDEEAHDILLKLREEKQ